MDKHSALTPFEAEVKAILDGTEPDEGFVQRLRLMLLHTHPQPKPGATGSPRLWGSGQPGWGWAAAAVTLAVLGIFLAIGPEQVVTAAQRWLGGFIPGVGFVDGDSRLLILEEPVEVSVDGAAITVEAAYTNTDETAIHILYQDDRRTCKNTAVTHDEYRSQLDEEVYLLLPDGSKLPALTPRFYEWGKFPPLPAGLDEVVLVVPPNVLHECPLSDSTLGEGASTFCQCLDEDLQWRIPLAFISPPPDSILPVVDSATPTAFPITRTTAGPAGLSIPDQTLPAPKPAPPDAGPQPELVGKLVTLDDGYLLLAALKRDPNAGASYSFGLNERHFQLRDAAGNDIPVEEVERSEVNPDVFEDFQWGDTILLRTQANPLTGPLTLTFPTLVQAQYTFGQEAEFTLDLGASLQVGQRIPVENRFDFIPGHPFTLREVAVDNLTADSLGLTLTFEGQGYETIQLNPVPFPDLPPQGGSSGQCGDFPGCFYTSIGLPPSAENRYRLAVSGLEHTIQGSWSLSFAPVESAP